MTPLVRITGAAILLIPLACTFGDPVDDNQAALATWENIAFANQTGVFVASFDAVPSASTEDVVVGLSRAPAAAYTDLAAIVRFGINGVIDVRSGASYTAAASVSNVAGKSYHVRMQVDVPNKKYTVRITPAGGAEVVLAQDAAFRDSQSTVTSLANRAKFGEVGHVTVSNVTIDGSPPTVTLTGPSDGQAIVVGTPVQLAAQASDDVGVTKVELYIGATRQCTLTAAPYSCSFTPTTAGSFAVQAKAYDAAGFIGTSSIATVAVTATPTWQNVAFTTQTATFTAAFDAVPTQNAEDVVIGLSRAPAAAYTDLAAIVRFGPSGVIDVRNGAAYGAAAAVSYTAGASYHVRMVVDVGSRTYSVYVTPPVHAEVALAQSYAFRDSQATVTSLANRAKLGDPGDIAISGFTITSAGDTTAPSVAMTAPAAGSTVSGTVTISASASDNVGVVGVQFLVDGVATGSEDTTGPYAISWNTASVTAGSHTLTARARDAAGNTTLSAPTALTVSGGGSAGVGVTPSEVGYKHAPGYPGALTPWSGGTLQSNQTYSFIDFPGFTSVGGMGASVSNVTFYGCRFRGSGSGAALVLLYGDNIKFDYVSFEPAVAAPPVSYTQGYQYGIEADGGWYTHAEQLNVTHSEFWGFGNAIDTTGSTQAKPQAFRYNWIHDARADGGVDHTDGIGTLSGGGTGSYILLDHNTIESVGNTNAIAFQAGSYSHITITNNLIGGWNDAVTVWAPAPYTTFTGNTFSTRLPIYNGVLYPQSFWTSTGSVWKCNKWRVPAGAAWGNPAHDGLYWVPSTATTGGTDDAPYVSAADYLGNASCP